MKEDKVLIAEITREGFALSILRQLNFGDALRNKDLFIEVSSPALPVVLHALRKAV